MSNKPPQQVNTITINQTTFFLFLGAIFVAALITASIVFQVLTGGLINEVRAAVVGSVNRSIGTAVAKNLPVEPTAKPNFVANVEVGDSATWGAIDAKVTIVEFSDFECPFCVDFYQQTYAQLKKDYGDKIRFAFRHFPLDMHPNAKKAALASECAREQDKFWEYHDVLFENQKDLSAAALQQYAQKVGIADLSRFSQCLETEKYKAKIEADTQAGLDYGIDGTPTFFVNGRRIPGAFPYTEFVKVIQEALAETQS